MNFLLLIFLAAMTMDVNELLLKPHKNAFSPSWGAYLPISGEMSLKILQPSESAKEAVWLNAVKTMLKNQAPTMSESVIHKIMKTLKCTHQYDVNHTPVLTVIDYSLPSNQKRLWVFDLEKKQLLFNTYVSHGIKSGILNSHYFSNTNNSKASSIGVFKTNESYYGRHGLALRLTGLEAGFNDQASRRAIVMHGGWYMEEEFVKKYGRPGRSWGCPAIPKTLTKSIIQTIKDEGLLVAYYPSERWFLQSKYFQCDNTCMHPNAKLATNLEEPEEARDAILFVEKNNNDRHEENEPIVVMSADDYIRTFNTNAPLKRMLRRQINKMEYIALNSNEFQSLLNQSSESQTIQANRLQDVFFVIPHVKRRNGAYLGTEMKFVKLGKIKNVSLNEDEPSGNSPSQFIVHFDNNPSLKLKTTDEFIRWLGL
ncbi:murein L,D-transpeptidase catalytic domain family protein [Legionella impletisoli]|uniref:Murein L,D-transpeptidase catalytic domain family protein n=1 Tax=Legionella impletisoli TaxID=343510 RepID=A0A917JQJ0_9GAMM|nr:murein L,D-transpeptidase catalytic domain family protein [Legionella impletisoli]GGI81882.1 hypothetical protein GCM10007966_08010 [Legionella impletisoli]